MSDSTLWASLIFIYIWFEKWDPNQRIGSHLRWVSNWLILKRTDAKPEEPYLKLLVSPFHQSLFTTPMMTRLWGRRRVDGWPAAMSTLMLSLVTLSMTVSLVVSIVLCICRNKPKQSSSVNVTNLLPLNSIRTSDLQSSQLDSIRFNGVNNVSADETDHHLRPHTQRALPDIPSLDTSQRLSIDEYDLGSDRIQAFEEQPIESKSRSSKGRAPQPPQASHRVMTCPTVSTNEVHHSYARIKDNAVIDSSENETDDYCDPQLCTSSARNITHNSDDLNPSLGPPTIGRFVANTSELPFIPCNPSTSRVIEEPVLPFLSNPPVLLTNHSIEPYGQLNEDIESNSNRTEISYNTISVREPLAKVLAERASSEHHYNEVEEERVSSFYEEIAGSTASSVTYSKIGDVLSNNPNQNDVRPQREVPIQRALVQSLVLESTDSTSTQPKQFANEVPNGEPFVSKDYLKDLYSSVDKKSKKSYNRQTIHCIPDSDIEFDNLYAKVQKVNNTTKESALMVNQRPSSVSELEPDSLHVVLDHSHPPPLPPPLKSSHSRSARTISLYDSFGSVPNASSHQRSYSSGNQTIDANDRLTRHMDDYYNNYDIVGVNPMDLEDNDPGYEVIQKKSASANRSRSQTDNPLINGIRTEFNSDPGYEAIGNDESDFDPNYEVITKKVVLNRRTVEVVEPSYEVIKKMPRIHPISARFEISRNISDVSSEPGYERIRFTQKAVTVDQTDAEPNYAFICRRDGSHQSNDDDDEQIISERLWSPLKQYLRLIACK